MSELHVPGTSARDYQQALDLNPRAVATFLRVAGWSKEDERPFTSEVWVSPDHAASLMLPLDATFSDFGIRFAEALRAISSVHRVTGEALALEIASARSDILLLRADQVTRNGTIPLLEAQQLLEGARKMLTAAACSAIRPRASTKGRKPTAVNDFLTDDVRMGHTMRGSFVLTIYAELDEYDRSQAVVDFPELRDDWHGRGGSEEDYVPMAASPIGVDDEGPAPFSRQVFSTLATGLDTARQLLSGVPIDLEEAIDSGVSAELLESLDEMSRSDGVRALDMAFRWSPSEGRLRNDLPNRVVVRRDQALESERFVERLRRKEVPDPTSIVGFVRRLERDQDDEEGIAIIEGTLDTEKGTRSVRVPLRGAQYRDAIRAHELRAPVVVEGAFRRVGRSMQTKGPVSIRPLPEAIGVRGMDEEPRGISAGEGPREIGPGPGPS